MVMLCAGCGNARHEHEGHGPLLALASVLGVGEGHLFHRKHSAGGVRLFCQNQEVFFRASLELLDVVYKVYPEEAQLRVVKFDMQQGMRVYILLAPRIFSLTRIRSEPHRCQGCQPYPESRCIGSQI
ncbi:hypothetical protein EMIT0196P_20520 [Pseudomonas chlororaphis]